MGHASVCGSAACEPPCVGFQRPGAEGRARQAAVHTVAGVCVCVCGRVREGRARGFQHRSGQSTARSADRVPPSLTVTYPGAGGGFCGLGALPRGGRRSPRRVWTWSPLSCSLARARMPGSGASWLLCRLPSRGRSRCSLRLPAQQGEGSGQPWQTPGHVVGLLKDQEEGPSKAHALGAQLSRLGPGLWVHLQVFQGFLVI